MSHVAVKHDTGEEVDRELWMLVEELREQNRTLLEDVHALQDRPAADGCANK